MSKVLYIKASPMKERSYSTRVADAFMNEYKKTHPTDEIKILELYSIKLPDFDFLAASGKYKVIHNLPHTPEEKNAWAEITRIVDEFKSFDKYIFSIPMWNFSIPYRLKQYIDILVQPGLTFTVDASGNYQGLVLNKPVFISYASGGEYPLGSASEAYDMQKKYIQLILGFIGLTDLRFLITAPTLMQGPDFAKQKLADAIAKAPSYVKDF